MSLLIATHNMGFSPVDLFMDADLVVKSVIIGLALSSVWVWTIVISFTVKMSGINKKSDIFEREFWGSSDIAAFAKTHSQNDLPVAKVFAAGMAEWRLSTNGKSIDRSGTRERLATAMDATIAAETDRLANRLNFLATTGSVAPFVGALCAALRRLRRSRIPALRLWHRALRKRCLPPQSACSPPSPRSSLITDSRTG
jgi:biopolymer transport protein TolQ